MSAPPVTKVVIVGGGTAGWMAAAALSRFLADGRRTITLVESEEIGTVGVGEATIPPIRNFNALLGIEERDFLRSTSGSMKLGIEFIGWGKEGDRYFHPFGAFGRDLHGINFHQLWLSLQGEKGIDGLEHFSISAAAASRARFQHPVTDTRSPLSTLNYAYHFDATLYAELLRRRSEAQGVRRIEGRIARVLRNSESGHVETLILEDGRRIEGELFIDCSGFRSLLLGQAMCVPFEDWSHWLPCDRAIALPTARAEPLLPYTRATARPAGWQWRIPLQHRTGNGHVYASAFMTDKTAETLLLAGLDGLPLDAPRHLSFRAGRRARCWDGNVVALGLASGFLEPLESTSIHLVQSGISKLLALFPDARFTNVERDEFNRLMEDGFTAIRDFIILHYHATERDDSPFWNYVRTMGIPDSLSHKLELFREKGRIFRYEDELFAVSNWVAVLLGQNVVPSGHDPLADSLEREKLVATLRHMSGVNAAVSERMEPHAAFLDRYLA